MLVAAKYAKHMQVQHAGLSVCLNRASPNQVVYHRVTPKIAILCVSKLFSDKPKSCQVENPVQYPMTSLLWLV